MLVGQVHNRLCFGSGYQELFHDFLLYTGNMLHQVIPHHEGGWRVSPGTNSPFINLPDIFSSLSQPFFLSLFLTETSAVEYLLIEGI